MRWSSCLLSVLVVAAAAARGDDPKPAPGPASPVRARLDAATAAWDRSMAATSRDYEAMEAQHLPPAEQAAGAEAIEGRWRRAVTPTLADLLAAAVEHPADPASVAGLGFVALKARGLPTDEARRALVALRRDHVGAPDISAATRTLFVHADKPEAVDLLRAVIAANPDRVERGRACHDLAWLLSFKASRLARRRDATGTPPAADPDPAATAADPAPILAEAEAVYDRCVAEFADVPLVGYGAGKTVGDFARGALFDLRHLQVGMPAPEIVGEDIDGRPLRLADHRGRVVVLVFSGEWCGPCRGNARYFRDLLRPEAQRASPCVVLEVNTDATREPVRQAIAAGEITWPCWFDGGVTGPITLGWGVESFPTIHVIDGRGVIRARDVRGEATATAVARVLAAEPPAGQP